MISTALQTAPQTLQVLENVYIGGKKIECTSYDQFVPELIQDHYRNVFRYSKFSRNFADQKIKLIFDELGIEYYGPYNDDIATLSADKEYDISKKLFDLLSKEYHVEEGGAEDLFEMINTGAPAGSSRVFSELYAYMLMCAGVDTAFVTADQPAVENYIRFDDKEAAAKAAKIAADEDDTYTWNVVWIGGNWYHTDITRSSLICEMNKTGTTNYGAFMFNDASWYIHEDQTSRGNMDRYDFLQSDRYTYTFSYQSGKSSYQNSKTTYTADVVYMLEDENGIIPYYGDVNSDYIREETDDCLVQGVLLIPDDIQAKIIAGEDLTADDIDRLGNVKVTNSTSGEPVSLTNADGSLAFDIKQCDLNFDGDYSMVDVMLSQQLHSFMSRSPLEGMNGNNYVPKNDNSLDETDTKMKLFDRYNYEACIGEAFYSIEQYTFKDFTDLVTRLNKTENMLPPVPMPTPAPPMQNEPDSGEKDETDTSDKTENGNGGNDTPAAGDTEDEVKVTKGDLNKDEKINATDIVLMASHIKGIKTLSEDRLEAADIDSNGIINVSDIAKIAAHIKGIKSIRK